MSLFKRLDFWRRMATTTKVTIAEKAHREIELFLLYKIIQKVGKCDIQPLLIVNFDQASSK